MPATLSIGDRVQIAGKIERYKGGVVIAGHNYEGGRLRSYVVAFGKGGSDVVNVQDISLITRSPIRGGPRVAETLLTTPPGDLPGIRKVFFKKKPTPTEVQRTREQISEAYRTGALGRTVLSRKRVLVPPFRPKRVYRKRPLPPPVRPKYVPSGPLYDPKEGLGAQRTKGGIVWEYTTLGWTPIASKRPTPQISLPPRTTTLPTIPYGTVTQKEPLFKYDITTTTRGPFTPVEPGLEGVSITEITETRRVGEPTFRVSSPALALEKLIAPPEEPVAGVEQIPERFVRGGLSVAAAPILGISLAGKYIVEKKKAGIPPANIIGGLIVGGTTAIIRGFTDIPKLVATRPAFGAGIVATFLVPIGTGLHGVPKRIKLRGPKAGRKPPKPVTTERIEILRRAEQIDLEAPKFLTAEEMAFRRLKRKKGIVTEADVAIAEMRSRRTAFELETAFKEASEVRRLYPQKVRRVDVLFGKLPRRRKIKGLKEVTYAERHVKAEVLFPAIRDILRPEAPPVRPKPKIVTAREILGEPKRPKPPPGYKAVETKPGMVQLVKVKTKQRQRLLQKQKQKQLQRQRLKERQLQKSMIERKPRLRSTLLPLQLQRQLKPIQKQRILQEQKSRVRQKERQRQRLVPLLGFKPASISKQKQRQRLKERQRLVSRLRLRARTRAVVGGLFPGLEETRRKFKKPKRTIPGARPIYKPSLIAIIGGITARKTPKRVTGLGIRPVIIRSRKRR